MPVAPKYVRPRGKRRIHRMLLWDPLHQLGRYRKLEVLS